MAQIAGLKEQKQALTDIEALLKEIKTINDFLQMDNPLGVYEISFCVDNPNTNTNLTSVENSVPSDRNDSSLIKEEKKPKRVSKNLKFAAPFLCPDKNIVRTCVLSSKKEKVERIKYLSEKFNIFLDNKEETILKMFMEDI